MKKAKFGYWLKESLVFVSYKPWLWASYTLLLGMVMPIGHISLALGIMLSVVSLFVGVGIAKYVDLLSSENPVSITWAIKKSLPLAILAATCIMVFWFLFMLIANLVTGELFKIIRFFFYWEFTSENINYRTTRELGVWLYSYVNVTFIFTLLMLTSFASWFSYPLMLFKSYSWTSAISDGNYIVSRNQSAMYKMLGFLVAEALLCTTITPLLTPVLYVLTSILMYVSYKSCFEVNK